MTRRSIDIPGLTHGDTPIPSASCVGPLFHTSAVFGVDRSAGKIPEDCRQECEHMFANLKALIEAAGGSLDDVVRVTVTVAAPEFRDAINPVWLRLFPDAAARPARKMIVQAQGGPTRMQLEAVAFLNKTVQHRRTQGQV